MNVFNVKKSHFSLAEMIFIGLMAALNMVVDIIASPAFKLIFTHIVAGILIMVPLNFLFLTLTKLLVDKPGTLTIYLVVFGVLSIPTSLFGGVAGPYKIVVGLAIGLLLDLAFWPKKIGIKIALGAILGSIFWWIATFTVWQAFNLPFVLAFSQMLNPAAPIYNGSINFSPFMQLPITGFGKDFFLFATFCGLLSAGPVLLACIFAHNLFKKIVPTAVYQRFKGLE